MKAVSRKAASSVRVHTVIHPLRGGFLRDRKRVEEPHSSKAKARGVRIKKQIN
jgi:hypothetical protein